MSTETEPDQSNSSSGFDDFFDTSVPSMAPIGLEAEASLARYAQVAMDSPGLTRSLTYSVPAELAELIQPGQLVWAPLSKGRAQGIVTTVSSEAPADFHFRARPLLDIVDLTPVLWPYQLQLIEWLSAYYYCSLYEAAGLMLPTGLSRAARPTLARTEAGRSFLLPPTLGANELFLLHLLSEQEPPVTVEDAGEATPAVLLNELKKVYLTKRGKTTFEKTVRNLEAQRLVQRGFFLPRPGVRPQLKPFVRLAPYLLDLAPDEPAILAKLGRSARQREVFEVVRRELEPGYLMPADEVCLLADTDLKTLRALSAKGLLEIETREVRRDPLSNRPQRLQAEEPPLLTYRQSLVWRSLLDSFQTAGPQTYLLHGVTGSGKTELYLRALGRVLKEGKQAIVLVPEIALTAQTVDRFAARFPGRVAVRHSKLSPGEAYDEWRRARDGSADIVIGARSALFSPLPRLGLIIMDEEHEWSYKQDESFAGNVLYHTRTVALELSRLTGAKVILGSATPAVESFFQAEQGEYELLSLPERVSPQSQNGEPSAEPLPLPSVQIVDLRQELKAGNSSIFSRDLQYSMQRTIAARQQAILFLNRRGTATIVMCRDCGTVVVCDACDTPLVFHADLDRLVCHRCGRRWVTPRRCPDPTCNSERIRHLGAGTKRVEDELQRLFPSARVMRWDQDTVAEGGRDSYQVLFDKMANHEADLLVGTQMIAKGLDLPLVSLVGVVTADTGLYLPDFRATERTFQLLTQVVGRAGRRKIPGQAIMQSYTPDHYVIQAAAQHDYASFYAQEIAFRYEHGYPPFSRLIKFVYSHKDEGHSRIEAERLAKELQQTFEEAGMAEDAGIYDFIGPAPAFQHKSHGMYRYQFLLRIYEVGPDDPQREAGLIIRRILADMRSRLHGWTVDVDPQSVL